jgi:hypothetical protein
MRQTTIESLSGCAKFLRDSYSRGQADADFITFGMATEYLRRFVDNEWTNQMVFGQHPTVSRANRAGRAFMRAEPEEAEERFRNQMRTLRIAEILFNLQAVEGIDSRLDDLRAGMVESTYAELECGAFMHRQGITFRYVVPSGLQGADYDAEIIMDDGGKVYCEMKCKAEETELSKGAVRNPLQTARTQLPQGQAGLVFLKVPERWLRQEQVVQIVPSTIDSFLRATSRVVAVVVRWEAQHLLPSGAAATLYRFRLERGAAPKAVSKPVGRILGVLAGPGLAPWVSFRAIAEQAVAR